MDAQKTILNNRILVFIKPLHPRIHKKHYLYYIFASLYWFVSVCIGLYQFVLVCISLYRFVSVCISLYEFVLVCMSLYILVGAAFFWFVIYLPISCTFLTKFGQFEFPALFLVLCLFVNLQFPAFFGR